MRRRCVFKLASHYKSKLIDPLIPTDLRGNTGERWVTVAKKVLAALGIGMIAIGAAMTIAFGTGQQAHADNNVGGAGTTITQSAAPTALGTPSAAPNVTAQPFLGGQGNGHS